MYQATSTVYINRTPATATATGIYDQSAATDPVRFFQTQADLARQPELLDQAAKAAGGTTGGALAGNSSVSPSANADLLIFSVKNWRSRRRCRGSRTRTRRSSRSSSPSRTVVPEHGTHDTGRRMATLRGNGVSQSSPVYADLLNRESQIATALVCRRGLRPAWCSRRLEPRRSVPARSEAPSSGSRSARSSASGLAFLRDALDKKTRSDDEIHEILRLPLLGRLAAPASSLRQGDQLVMLADPNSPQAERFRKLRTNLEFVNLDASTGRS